MIWKKIFRSTDRPIGRISDWAGVFSLAAALIGAISWPTSSIEAIHQYGWGAIFLTSLLFVCMFLVSASLFLMGFRKFRPLPTTLIGEEPPQSKRMEAISEEIQNLRKACEIHNMLIQNARDSIKSNKLATDNYLKSYEAMLGGTQEQMATLRKTLNQIFSAQLTQGIYKNLTAEIELLIEELSDPMNKKDKFSNWSQWANQWRQLDSKLRYLTHLVEEYTDVRDEIFSVPSEKFRSQYWSFDSTGMSEDQKHEYKTFQIISNNYKGAKAKISSKLLNALYSKV